MKASRIAALGLVAAAGLWIASGHFLPRESAQSNAAIRTGDGEGKKLFRVAVVPNAVGVRALDRALRAAARRRFANSHARATS